MRKIARAPLEPVTGMVVAMQMEYDRHETLIQRADHAEQSARRMQEPGVKETMFALAELYRELAKQLQELAELKERARKLY